MGRVNGIDAKIQQMKNIIAGLSVLDVNITSDTINVYTNLEADVEEILAMVNISPPMPSNKPSNEQLLAQLKTILNI